jgi:hypothetical protein
MTPEETAPLGRTSSDDCLSGGSRLGPLEFDSAFTAGYHLGTEATLSEAITLADEIQSLGGTVTELQAAAGGRATPTNATRQFDGS